MQAWCAFVTELICNIIFDSKPDRKTIFGSPHERELKTVLVSVFCAVDSGFQALDSRFFVTGIGIPDSNH